VDLGVTMSTDEGDNEHLLENSGDSTDISAELDAVLGLGAHSAKSQKEVERALLNARRSKDTLLSRRSKSAESAGSSGSAGNSRNITPNANVGFLGVASPSGVGGSGSPGLLGNLGNANGLSPKEQVL
jgi:hypothetical protein